MNGTILSRSSVLLFLLIVVAPMQSNAKNIDIQERSPMKNLLKMGCALALTVDVVAIPLYEGFFNALYSPRYWVTSMIKLASASLLFSQGYFDLTGRNLCDDLGHCYDSKDSTKELKDEEEIEEGSCAETRQS